MCVSGGGGGESNLVCKDNDENRRHLPAVLSGEQNRFVRR